MALSKDQILEANDCAPVRIDTPEWGGDGYVYCRAIGGTDRDRYDQFQNGRRWPEDGEPDWGGLRANLVALGLCDEDGESLGFTELEIAKLGEKGAALERCFDVIRDLSGMTVKAAEQAEKNSSGTPTESSG